MLNTQSTQTSTGRQVLVFDPIHKVVQLPPDLKEPVNRIIDSALYQRMRGIRQMGMAEMVFPSATHTRLLHGLGACYLAYRIGSIVDLDEDMLRLAAIAGLLHDIGHGPLSHAFELFLEDVLGFPVRHEQWTQQFIEKGHSEHDWFASLGYDAKLRKQLVGIIKGEPKSAPKKYPGQLRLVGDIISSQLDADRLDYLLRDSHFCGVSYGMVDLEWLLYCMVPVATSEGLRLGINDKAIGTAEEFFMARRLMYQNVYYHKKIMAFEQLLVAFLRELLNDDASRKRLGGPLSQFLDGLRDYREKDSNSLMQDKFESYAQLRDYDLWLAIRSVSVDKAYSPTLRYLADCFERHREPCMFRMSSRRIEEFGPRVAALRHELGDQAWKVELKTVRIGTHTRDGDHPVADSRGNHGARELGRLSDLISLLGKHPEPFTYLLVEAGLYEQSPWRGRIDAIVKEAGILR